jgi:hypothetical protein
MSLKHRKHRSDHGDLPGKNLADPDSGKDADMWVNFQARKMVLILCRLNISAAPTITFMPPINKAET